MLTQYKLQLEPEEPCRLRPEMSYHLYAALLDRIPQQIARDYHRQGITPVSQYALPRRDGSLLWTVTVFGGAYQQPLAEALTDPAPWILRQDRTVLRPRQGAAETVESGMDLLRLGEESTRVHRLRVQTPAAFKSRGRYQSLPSERLILQSLMKQWNGCFPDCPIEDTDGMGMEAMAEGLQLEDFALHGRGYYLKGSRVPGFVGSLTVRNRLEGFHRTLADALLLFSGYAGIGIKTTLGMGGTVHENLPD